MPTVSTANVNGVRAATVKGLLDWIAASDADVICLQEVRARPEEVPPALTTLLAERGLHLTLAPSETAKGRNGVAVLSRSEPSAVRVGFGDPESDDEGRYLEVDLPEPDGRVALPPQGSHRDREAGAQGPFPGALRPLPRRRVAARTRRRARDGRVRRLEPGARRGGRPQLAEQPDELRLPAARAGVVGGAGRARLGGRGAGGRPGRPRARTRGGPTAGGRSTTTWAGGSITSSRHRGSPRGRRTPSSTGRRRTPSAGRAHAPVTVRYAPPEARRSRGEAAALRGRRQ